MIDIKLSLGVKNFVLILFLLTIVSSKYRYLSFQGPLTQLVEYLPFKQRVAGSSPARPTICVPIV
jgi:hypothetical protein